MFSDKLDMIMKITNTPNKALAKAVALDASHISRLRGGSRKLPKNPIFLPDMSEYFISKLSSDDLKKKFCDLLQLSEGYPSTDEEASEMLLKWFLDDSTGTDNYIKSFLKDLDDPTYEKPADSDVLNSFIPTYSNYYFGAQGKKNAVLRLLRDALFQNDSNTLYLFSDEISHLIENDDSYARSLIDAFGALAAMGHHIDVVHSKRKNTDSMLKSIFRWSPLYFTSQLTPYYYPKRRDDLFHRTLFLMPDVGAVVSSSVGDKMNNTLTMYIRDKQAISSLHEEFTNLLSLCKPIMSSYSEKDNPTFAKKLCDFDAVLAESIMKPRHLSLVTLPESVRRSVSLRSYPVDPLAILEKRSQIFEKNLETQRVTEIINLPDPTHLEEGKIKIPMIELLGTGYVYYTKKEFIEHLEHIIYLLQTYENYNVIINDGYIEGEYLMHVKKNSELLFVRATTPTMAMTIHEPWVIDTFWKFVNSQVKRIKSKNSKNDVIVKLRNYITLLN